jgi:hypothetical protein
MQSRIMKGITLTIITLALPVVAFAQTSRIAGMGTQGDYVKDYTNMFAYPSYVTQVGNLVYGEFGVVSDYNDNYSEYFNTEDRSIGAVLGNLFDGKYGTWAFHMREYTPALGTNSQPSIQYDGYLDEYLFGTGYETFSPYIDPNVPGSTGYTPFWNGDYFPGVGYMPYGVEAFDLMWGKKINNLNVGLRMNQSRFKYEQTGAGTSEGYAPYDRNIFGFGGGLGFTINPNTNADVGFQYQSRTFKYDDGAGSTFESDGGGAYLFSGRVLWQYKPNLLVVPVIRMYSFDESTKSYDSETATSTTYDAKISGWQAGFAGNWTLNQNDLFVAGLTFASNTWDYSTDKSKYTESLMPTMFASLETHVNSWWTLRFGGRKGVYYSVKHEDSSVTPTVETKVSNSPFQFFMGTGVKMGSLQFDATLAQDFFHNPATYVTGSPNGQNDYAALFPKVTATYNF